MKTARESVAAINKPLEYYKKFAQSQYGQSLAGKLRWSRYKPKHLSAEQWVALLGIEADGIAHTRSTYDLATSFLKTDSEQASLNINSDERTYLLLASIAYGWSESYGDDINYEEITPKQTELKIDMFRKVFDELVGVSETKLRYIIETIAFKSNNKLGKIFNAIERMGYVKLALEAMRIAQATDDKKLASHLKWLAASVFSNQLISLLGYAECYYPIKQFLVDSKQDIDEALNQLDAKIFVAHGQAQITRHDQLDQAKVVWQRSMNVDQDGIAPAEESHDRGILGSGVNFEERYIPDYVQLKLHIGALRTLGLKIVLTSGSFDMIHIGHAKYIEKARQYGDILVVGVDSDDKIRQRKGPHRPVVEQDERLRMIAHLRDADIITLKPPGRPRWELIKLIHPDTLIATAETYTATEIEQLEAKYCDRVVVLEPQATTSTSARLRDINLRSTETVVGEILAAVKSGATHQELEILIQKALGKNGNS